MGRRAGGADAAKPGPRGIASAERERAAVDVDRPDARPGGAGGQHERERPVAAAEIEQLAGGWRRRGCLKQQPGPRIQPARREHAGVGL